MRRAVVAVLPLAYLVASCSIVLSPGEQQCDTTSDCAARGFANAVCKSNLCISKDSVDPVWGCLGHVVAPVPDTSKTLDLSVRLAFATDESPLPEDTVVDVCQKLDIECTAMSPDFPKGLHPGPNGIFSATLREGFDGFLRITQSEIVDSRVYVGPPIVVPPKVGEVRLLRPTEYQFLASIAGKQVDPTRGTGILLAVDCSGDAAAGVRFEVPTADSSSQEFYLINMAPVLPPTATSTDKDGFGGLLNLPAGAAVARAYREADSAYIGQSSFQVLANTISYVLVAPTPQ